MKICERTRQCVINNGADFKWICGISFVITVFLWSFSEARSAFYLLKIPAAFFLAVSVVFLMLSALSVRLKNLDPGLMQNEDSVTILQGEQVCGSVDRCSDTKTGLLSELSLPNSPPPRYEETCFIDVQERVPPPRYDMLIPATSIEDVGRCFEERVPPPRYETSIPATPPPSYMSKEDLGRCSEDNTAVLPDCTPTGVHYRGRGSFEDH